MKKILIPTDFSETARDAYLYALDYCKAIGEPFAIKVVHVFMPETPATPTFIPPVQEFMELKEQTLKAFTADIPGKPDNVEDLSSEIAVGFPINELIELSKEFDLIVMGTTGNGGFLEKMFGSVSSSVAQKAHCPVLLIPDDVTFKKPDQILYASNADAADERLIEQLTLFNTPFQARLHFVHVEKEGEPAFGKSRDEIFETLFADGEPPFAFEFSTVASTDVEAALDRYATAQKIDMTVMATRHRSFWEQLFHKSQTKQMALHARFPLLVLHQGD